MNAQDQINNKLICTDEIVGNNPVLSIIKLN